MISQVIQARNIKYTDLDDCSMDDEHCLVKVKVIAGRGTRISVE